nr:class I SAM-dependent methyltransferase [Kibdelosporangium sp. MJ126-NF4]CEL13333.1 Methyltransferase type 11 [Kibdelosporangium sp. MJ126-NF4]CTQ99024.1 Methyltransferase type 11 [Kibdelosporangium sp. MJ126-NF4]
MTHRATSFGQQATAYAEYRPGYPDSAIDWVLASRAGSPGHVLDLAAGTGALTKDLLTRAARVTAVEPDPAMRDELVRRVPGVHVLDGTAERIPLGDAEVDAVYVGQAFHWFDQDRALAEIGRVLRPGGVLGALWNDEDQRVDWIAELVRLTGTGVDGASDDLAGRELPAHPLFTRPERAEFDHVHRFTAESLTAAIATLSHALIATQRARAEMLERVQGYLRSRRETAHGEFEVALRTTVARAHRRDERETPR